MSTNYKLLFLRAFVIHMKGMAGWLKRHVGQVFYRETQFEGSVGGFIHETSFGGHSVIIRTWNGEVISERVS